MAYIARALRLLSIVVWVGGLTFFAFIEAPTAFHVMGTTAEFAQLIGGSVGTINMVGNVAGLIFLLATFVLYRRKPQRTRRLLASEMLLVLLMIAATAYVQLRIVPAMERDRASVGGDINSAPTANPARADFDSLHAASEKLEGATLLMGICVVLLIAAEDESIIPTR